MRAPFFLFAATLVACSSADFSVAGGAIDAANDDTASSGGDSNPPADSGNASDSSPSDSSIGDTGGPIDATPPTDSTPPPTDGAAGDGNTCPMPPNTNPPPSFEKLSCDQLQTAYQEALAGAETCGCDKDCSATVCQDFCCNCQVYVNPGAQTFPSIAAIQKAWNDEKCITACTDAFCPPPAPAHCAGAATGGHSTCSSVPTP